jgi:hypothetical protein
MKHHIIKLSLGLLIIVAVVGGVVSWQWPNLDIPQDRVERSTSTSDWLTEATSSLVESLPTVAGGPPPAEADPVIKWNPKSISEAILAGESKTISVRFTSEEDLRDVVVRVTREIAPFVRVDPSAFARVVEDETMNLSITMSVPPDALPHTVRGTIQLRGQEDERRAQQKNLAKPLPVTLRVQRPEEPEAVTFSFADLEVIPRTINVDIPTSVVAVINVPDLRLIPSSIILHRLDDHGRVIANLGLMRDDGQAGDLVANDRRHTIEVAFSEVTEGRIRLRASAGFRGLRQRLFSGEAIVLVIPFVEDTGPEVLLQEAARAFATARTVAEVSRFIHPQVAPKLQQVLDLGASLSDFTEIIENARLSSKTEDSAIFSTTVTVGPGQVYRSTIVVRRGAEGWRIVDL